MTMSRLEGQGDADERTDIVRQFSVINLPVHVSPNGPLQRCPTFRRCDRIRRICEDATTIRPEPSIRRNVFRHTVTTDAFMCRAV